MGFENKEAGAPKTPEKEISKEKDHVDDFMIPEKWIEDVTEAQKEAYKIKVLAYLNAIAEKLIEEGDDNRSATLKPLFTSIKETSIEPTTANYESAAESYKEIFEDRFKLPGDKGLDIPVRKITDLIAGNILRSYIELRARMLAKKERETNK